MSDYLTEAFQKLRLLEDDFDLSADKGKIDELKSFVADDIEIPEEEVIDVEAVSEEDLADNYNGKVILECECCHARVYKDIEDVFIDDETQTANVDEECPVCNNTLGYTVIGKIEPFEKAKEIEVNVEDNDEVETGEGDLELESLKKVYKGGIKIKEDLDEKSEELPDDDIEEDDVLTESSADSFDPNDPENSESDIVLQDPNEFGYRADTVTKRLSSSDSFDAKGLPEDVIDEIQAIVNDLTSDESRDLYQDDAEFVTYAYDSIVEPYSDDGILNIDEGPIVDYLDENPDDEDVVLGEIARYYDWALKKKVGKDWEDLVDKDIYEGSILDMYGDINESCKSRKGKKIKESKLQENAWTKLVKAFPELEEDLSSDLDEGVRRFEDTDLADAVNGNMIRIGSHNFRVNRDKLDSTELDPTEKHNFRTNRDKLDPNKKIKKDSVLNKLMSTAPDLDEDVCPECGKTPCECDKVEEACSKKAKKGSAWDKLKKKNPELKEQKLTEAPWVWKDEDEDNNNSNVEPLEGNIEDLGLSKKAVAEYYDCLDSFVKYFDRECLADFFEDPYDPENSIHDVFDSAKVLRNDIKKKALTAGKEGSKEYWNERNRYWDKVCELGLDYLEKNIELDESCKSRKGKKKINESPWVWKDDDEVEDGEDNNFSQEEINDAVKNAAKMILADPEATEIGEWIKEKAGLPDNIDPILAYCKFESEIDEMPGEGLFGKILHDDDSEFYDYWLNVYDFEERIAEYLGEFGLEKFGHTAWAKCKIRPGAFYDFGESFKESVEVTAKGEDNVNVSKNDDGSMDINVSSTEPGEGEEIVPLEDEEISEIEANEPEEEGEEEVETEEGETESEGGEEETAEEGTEEEVGEFDEESFDNMGESYMRKIYSNVKSYHTTSVADTGSELILEGYITFQSGAKRKTSFVLKDKGTNKFNKRIFEGYNKTFSNSSKAFRITGAMDNGRYYPKTFKYNYKTKTINESNKSEVFKVQGLIKAENCRVRHGK